MFLKTFGRRIINSPALTRYNTLFTAPMVKFQRRFKSHDAGANEDHNPHELPSHGYYGTAEDDYMKLVLTLMLLPMGYYVFHQLQRFRDEADIRKLPQHLKVVDYYKAAADEIAGILEDEEHDDGSLGPLFVRLAWHASGTYDKGTNKGGSNGATMRFEPESSDPANAGLDLARERLEEVHKKFPGMSKADLWTLAACVAITEMGGPVIKWHPGRKEFDGTYVPPNGRLPDGSKGADHIRDVFYRMGFKDQEIVALAGAHALGRCHPERSGYKNPWTRAPTTFSNEYFKQLLETKWTKKNWDGPTQFEDPTGELMMLPADLAFIEDPEFKKYVVRYSKDEELFFKDFAKAFQKLLELGVDIHKSAPPVTYGDGTPPGPNRPTWSYW
ncbi:heme peroxidase [Rozella allomycis CSF55]|uniref:Peroxidase n=1 Tax=Rozella allomycis (strain CSF55) TaxID=988480 RepID=A0A4V1IZT2_ROZAC|nr:heme peroxidase [Rozella allomycis CSF55]